MFYAVTDRKVFAGKSLSVINRTIEGKLDLDEFHCLGGDYIVYLTPDDLDFVQDKKKLSSIMFGNFFKKDNTVKIISVILLILNFIILVRV